jgi:hypothetical protein
MYLTFIRFMLQNVMIIFLEEDLDLRILPMTSNKRQSTELLQPSNAKKSKDERFDE